MTSNQTSRLVGPSDTHDAQHQASSRPASPHENMSFIYRHNDGHNSSAEDQLMETTQSLNLEATSASVLVKDVITCADCAKTFARRMDYK